MPLPTFVIPGAQKSGTTTLHGLLGQHPQIWVSEPKELHFFDQHQDRGTDWYAAQFSPGPEHRAWGESTPYYLYNDRVRAAMARALPEARFIVVLREPVARAYSHYWFARSKGLETLPTFEQAVAAEPGRLAGRRGGKPAKFSYLDRGRYLQQLTSLVSLVGRDRVLVHLFEDLTGDPLRVVKESCRFVGVDSTVIDNIDLAARNTFAARTLNRDPAGARVTAGQRAEGVPTDTYPPLDPALDAQLRHAFAEENRALGAWLGRDLSDWL